MSRRKAITAALLMCLATSQALQAGSPFAPRKGRKDVRQGTITLSTDEKLVGLIWTTRGKAFRIFDRPSNAYEDVKFEELAKAEMAVESKIVEQDWRWKQGGSDVKVFTEWWYLWHKYVTTFTLTDGTKLVGDVVAPIYIKKDDDGKVVRYEFHKRDKGPKSKKKDLKPLVHIKEITFDDVEEKE